MKVNLLFFRDKFLDLITFEKFQRYYAVLCLCIIA